MMNRMALALTGLLTVAATAPDSQTAIRCTGTQKRAMGDLKSVDTATVSRLYVIDDAKKDVSFYNAKLGKLFSLCDGKADCRFDFSPETISLNWSGGGASDVVTIDRKAGTFSNLMNAPGHMTYQFKGNCEKADYPAVADVPANRF